MYLLSLWIYISMSVCVFVFVWVVEHLSLFVYLLVNCVVSQCISNNNEMIMFSKTIVIQFCCRDKTTSNHGNNINCYHFHYYFSISFLLLLLLAFLFSFIIILIIVIIGVFDSRNQLDLRHIIKFLTLHKNTVQYSTVLNCTVQ